MSNFSSRVFSIFILLISITISASSSAMTNMKGEPSSIEAFTGNGKWLIVQAWASRCPICNKAMPDLVKSAHSFPNAKVLGVSLDGSRTSAQKFINKHKVNFPTLVSNNREFDAYLRKVAGEKLTGTPTYLIFTPNGQLVGLQPGNVPPTTLKNFLRQQQR